MTTRLPGLRYVDHAAFTVPDLAQAVRFFVDVLGAEELYRSRRGPDASFMPANFDENMQSYLKVSSALREIKGKIPMDLIVHTRPMHEKFIELGSMFSREVERNGEVLYEQNS